MTRPIASAVLLVATTCLGCQRTAELHYVSSKEVLDLSDALQQRVREILDKRCGTPARPKLLGNEKADVVQLKRGATIYQKRCAACHGVTGDGNGVAAGYLYPRPRDYRRGVFKFTSTPYGAKPRREDLRRTIRQGAKGTSMPSFSQLPDDELAAVSGDATQGAQRLGEKLLVPVEGGLLPDDKVAAVRDLRRQKTPVAPPLAILGGMEDAPLTLRTASS